MLSDRDRALLDFDAAHMGHHDGKQEAIRLAFDLSAPRYYQLLDVLIDSPDAVEAEPVLVKALHRLRDERRDQRRSRTFPPPR